VPVGKGNCSEEVMTWLHCATPLSKDRRCSKWQDSTEVASRVLGLRWLLRASANRRVAYIKGRSEGWRITLRAAKYEKLPAY